ncbi:MAG: hypothetical protein IIV02_07330 [Peptococcaceae bacterium]|nr:hypothetical protein [Peptococcaceae bacterium]
MEKLKYVVAGLLLFMVSFVGGCCGADAKTAEAYEQVRMSQVESCGMFHIYKDNRTGVHYLVYDKTPGRVSGAAMCVMVDAEGKPLVDKGE